GIILGDIRRRTVETLRIEVPDAADVPPPAHPAVIDLMMPPAAFPGEMATIGMAYEGTGRDRAAVHDTGAARYAANMGTRSRAANVRPRPRTADARSRDGARRTRTGGRCAPRRAAPRPPHNPQ